MPARPDLRRGLAAARPEQAGAGIGAQAEDAQRAQLAAQRQERARQAAEAAAREAPRPRHRGPSLGM
jgi:hypothetical protein